MFDSKSVVDSQYLTNSPNPHVSGVNLKCTAISIAGSGQTPQLGEPRGQTYIQYKYRARGRFAHSNKARTAVSIASMFLRFPILPAAPPQIVLTPQLVPRTRLPVIHHARNLKRGTFLYIFSVIQSSCCKQVQS